MAAADIEYYISKDRTIAFKIFELGMKKFSDEAQYILSYLDFLSHMNGEVKGGHDHRLNAVCIILYAQRITIQGYCTKRPYHQSLRIKPGGCGLFVGVA